MPDQRALTAIGRIERALARLEAAAAAERPAPAAAPRDDSDLIELRQVHQALRSKVEGAIAQIDRLLETGGTA